MELCIHIVVWTLSLFLVIERVVVKRLVHWTLDQEVTGSNLDGA